MPPCHHFSLFLRLRRWANYQSSHQSPHSHSAEQIITRLPTHSQSNFVNAPDALPSGGRLSFQRQRLVCPALHAPVSSTEMPMLALTAHCSGYEICESSTNSSGTAAATLKRKPSTARPRLKFLLIRAPFQRRAARPAGTV